MTVRVTGQANATTNDTRYTAANIGFVGANDRAGLQRAAAAAGMSATGQADTYSAPDGSWIFMDRNGRVQRGVGGTQWVGMPSNAAARAQQAQRPVAQPAQGGGYTAQSMRATALGRLPMLTQGYSAGVNTLISHGFQQSGSSFIHADGSRVDWSGNSPMLSYNGTPLASLPRWW